MPKPTFLNLPATKRQTIIDLAIAEFAEHPYQAASLSRIVERAGIAKGSLYQYFADKQDLYLFLVDYAARQQLELLRAQTPPEPQLGFFALLRWQMQASLQVGLAAPQLTRLMYRAFADELPFREEIVRRMQTAGAEHMQMLLRAGVARGEIDPTLDLELASFVLQRMTANLHELLLRRLGVTFEAAAHDVRLLSGPVVDQLYDQLIQMLQFGLSPRGKPAPGKGEV